MDHERARRIREGLDTAAGSFWWALGIAWAVALVAFVLIGVVASVAWAVGRV